MINANTTKIEPKAAVNTGQPRITAAPLTDFQDSPSARKITEILFNKRVCLALDNQALETYFGGLHTVFHYGIKPERIKILPDSEMPPALLDCRMIITDFATLVRMLPKLQNDVLVLHNPIDLAAGSAALREGLKAFRKANPHAVVVSAVASGDASMAVLANSEVELLKSDGFVDCICKPAATDITAGVTTSDLMHAAAMLVERKPVAVTCSPDDIHETVVVLTEPPLE